MEVDEAGIAEKQERVTERLQRRHEERVAEVERKREEQSGEDSKKTSIAYFYKTFQEEKLSIEKELDDLSTSDIKLQKQELTERFDSAVHRVKRLQKYVADYTSVLPNYDILRAQGAANELLNSIQSKREAMIPKKKFAFKSRKKETTTAVMKNDSKEESNDSEGMESINKSSFALESKGFSDKTSETLKMSSDDILLQDISLSNLTSCKVIIEGYPSAVHVNNLKDCKVFCGPVPGSIFVDNCENCVFVIACQQLRVHHTKDTQFYLHVTSRGIIEDTTSVLFAPYNWEYPRMKEDYRESGLDVNRNAWDDIDDFNWLASDKHSPNWGILPESQRVQKWE